jgi:hypothetical protein
MKKFIVIAAFGLMGIWTISAQQEAEEVLKVEQELASYNLEVRRAYRSVSTREFEIYLINTTKESLSKKILLGKFYCKKELIDCYHTIIKNKDEIILNKDNGGALYSF